MTNRFFNISAFFYFYFSIVGVWVIFLPKILQNLGYSAAEIGIIFSIQPLMRFLTPFFFLKLFSLTKNVLHVTLVMMLLSIPLLYLTIDSFIPFAITNVFFGISFGLVLPYIETYALGSLKKEGYGRSRLWGSIGFTIISLVLARMFSTNIGLHFIAVSVVLSVVFAYFISLDDEHFNNQKNINKSNFSLLKWKYLWISIFLMQMSFGAFYSFFTIYETDHGISLTTVSYLWSFGVLCEIILFYYQSHFIKHNLLKIIQFTLLITAFRWLLLYLFPDSIFVSYLSQSFHAFSFALYHTATLSYLYTIYEDKKLTSQFYYGLGFGLGGFVGSLVAGWFYGEHLFLSSAIIAFASFIFLYLHKKIKSHLY